MKLLLVDDNEQNLYMLKVLFESHGFKALEACNGAEALALAQNTPVDLVISDILMPVMDGFNLCREWKHHPRLASVPFVFYTATYVDPKDEEFALSLGADEFLVKPQDPGFLVEMVKKYQKKKNTPPAEQPLQEDEAFLRGHNEVLVKKLEKKIQELEQSHKKLEEARRLESIGQFAAGIAHDFNNMLTAVTGNINIINLIAQDHAEISHAAENALSTIRKASNLVRQILTFARQQSISLVPLNLQEVINGFVPTLRNLLPPQVEIKLVESPVPLPVLGGAVQLEEVLLNLCINGGDAMPEGGTLTVEAKKVQAGPEYPPQGVIRIQDTGSGMDQATMDRIFEPFFTTKGSKGTGLGLSVVYGIIQQHGGKIQVTSIPGKGSVFEIILPLTSAPSPS